MEISQSDLVRFVTGSKPKAAFIEMTGSEVKRTFCQSDQVRNVKALLPKRQVKMTKNYRTTANRKDNIHTLTRKGEAGR